MGPIYATVGVQFPAEEKQQVAEDQSLGDSVLDMWSLCAQLNMILKVRCFG